MLESNSDDQWRIGDRAFGSRVVLGSARYPNTQVLLEALEASGTELVTVSLRRVPANAGGAENLYRLLREHHYTVLPNTAGCFTAREAVLTAQLAREALETSLIKLEVIADKHTLLPESEQLLLAAAELVRDGFEVMPYTNDDPVTAQKLEDLGCVAVMPLASPIGTGMGIRNAHNLAMIAQRAKVPVIVDAGLGTASDVAEAFELGCDAVLLNSAVARAREPVRMARAVGAAAQAGRDAFLAGRMPRKEHADSASELEGLPWR